MFNRLKHSMVIEKAYLIWSKDLGLDIKNLISKLPFAEGATYRENLRDMQTKMGLELYDVVVMMVIPFLDFLDALTRGDITYAVEVWYQEGRIQPDVYNFFSTKNKS